MLLIQNKCTTKYKYKAEKICKNLSKYKYIADNNDQSSSHKYK